MANSSDVSIEGLDELESALSSLELVAQKKVLRKAAREGMKPALSEAQRGVKSKWGELSGALHDSVRMRISAPKNKKWADVIGSIGVFRIRPLESIAMAWYSKGYVGAPTLAYWFEFGVQPHSLGKRSRRERGKSTGGGEHPGIPAKPVLRPAMDNNVDIITARTGNVLGHEIDKITKKQR